MLSRKKRRGAGFLDDAGHALACIIRCMVRKSEVRSRGREKSAPRRNCEIRQVVVPADRDMIVNIFLSVPELGRYLT